ncbi:coiled-coil domain-containing protein 110 isoform X2 [Pogona vitticeps]
MGRGAVGRPPDKMSAGFGYRSRQSNRRDSSGFESLGEENKALPSASGSPDTRAADKAASGRDGQVQPQSALKILQQQLESFQAHRQKTLENVIMVQSEISGILNKKISDINISKFNSNNLCLSSTPINTSMPGEYLEASNFKKQVHIHNRSGTSHCPETDFNAICRNMTAGEDISHEHLLKYKTVGKLEKHAQIYRNKTILAVNNDHELKSAKNLSPPFFVGMETQERTSLREIQSYESPKILSKAEDEGDEHLTESMSFSSKNLRDKRKKTDRHELSYTSELPSSPNFVCGKDNDSGYLSEQDLTEKAIDVSNEDFTFKSISELENNQNAAQMSFGKCSNSELLMEDSFVDKMQFKVLSKLTKDQFLIQKHTEDRQTDKQKEVFSLNQEFQNCEDLEFYDANVVSGDYAKKMRLLQLSVRESEHIQKNVVNFERENTDLKNQLKPLTDIIHSLTEQNSNYQKQIKDLQDEKNNFQGRLVKSEGDCKECLKEVKRLMKKFKELQQQKASLEEKQDHLSAQNQHMMQEISDFQKKDQQAQENLAFFTKEKNDLIVALASMEKQVSIIHEENKALEEKICQVTDKNSFLENALEEKQKEIQRLKEKAKTAVSDREALLMRMQSLDEEKRKLGETLQEALKDKEVLQKELGDAQHDKAHSREKLLTECNSAKVEIRVLKTKLSNMERECERLTGVITGGTENNWVLKQQAHEYKQDALECKNKIRQLREELLLMENRMRNAENEREVLKFEAHRLHKDNVSLKDQVTALINAQSKQRFYSERQHGNGQLADPTGICEEISRYQHISFIHRVSGNSWQTPSIIPSKKL